jgi:ribonuclease VapC
MPIEVVAVDLALAETAAELKAAHKISLADAFAAALAMQRRAELVTGDPEFKPLEGKIKLRWLGKD